MMRKARVARRHHVDTAVCSPYPEEEDEEDAAAATLSLSSSSSVSGADGHDVLPPDDMEEEEEEEKKHHNDTDSVVLTTTGTGPAAASAAIPATGVAAADGTPTGDTIAAAAAVPADSSSHHLVSSPPSSQHARPMHHHRHSQSSPRTPIHAIAAAATPSLEQMSLKRQFSDQVMRAFGDHASSWARQYDSMDLSKQRGSMFDEVFSARKREKAAAAAAAAAAHQHHSYGVDLTTSSPSATSSSVNTSSSDVAKAAFLHAQPPRAKRTQSSWDGTLSSLQAARNLVSLQNQQQEPLVRATSDGVQQRKTARQRQQLAPLLPLALRETKADRWSVEEVALWIDAQPVPLPSLRETFLHSHIDGKLLLRLTDDVLREDFGISSALMRLRVRAAIEVLQQQQQQHHGQQHQQQLSEMASISTGSDGTAANNATTNSSFAGALLIKYEHLSGIEPLRQGQYGQTFLAEWQHARAVASSTDGRSPPFRYHADGDPQRVVIKVSKERPGVNEWSEFKTFLDVPPHENVLPLIGICTDFCVPRRTLDGAAATSSSPRGAGGGCSFVTEFVVGGSLKDAMASGLFRVNWQRVASVRKAVQFAAGIAHGLAHLHSCGVLHRDLASRNVLCAPKNRGVSVSDTIHENAEARRESDDSSWTAVLCDFGLARSVVEHDSMRGSEVAESSYYSSARDAALPLRWMAPESFRGKYTRASDIWSCGVLLWEMLTGGKMVPFHGVTCAIKLSTGIVTGELRLLIPQSCPAPLRVIVESCLSFDAEKRPTATQLCAQLTGLELAASDLTRISDVVPVAGSVTGGLSTKFTGGQVQQGRFDYDAL